MPIFKMQKEKKKRLQKNRKGKRRKQRKIENKNEITHIIN